jgi:hypothetical protein
MASIHRAFLVLGVLGLLIKHSIDRQRQSITYPTFGDNCQLFDLILAINAHEDVIEQFIRILLRSLPRLEHENGPARYY